MGVSLGCHCIQGVLPVASVYAWENQVSGFRRRLCLQMPPVDRKKMRNFRAFCHYWQRELFDPLPSSTDFSFDTWLKNAPYTQARKAELERIHGLIPYRWRKRDWRSHGRCKAFVKVEYYTNVGGMFKPPRIISSRTDYIKVIVGPIVHQIENAVFAQRWFIKHVGHPERPSHVRDKLVRSGNRYLSSDFTSYEASQLRAVMKACEFPFYRYMLRDCPRELAIISEFERICTGLNVLQMRDITCTIPARRMSGEMTTSLGNGILNLMLHMFVFAPHISPKDLLILVEGDDGLMSIPHNVPVPDVKRYAELGFRLKLEQSRDVSEASFCGCVYDPDDGLIITDPIDEILSFGWSIGQTYMVKDTRLKQLLMAKTYSLAYQYPGCPVLHAMARAYSRLCAGVQWIEILEKPYFNQWERTTLVSASKRNLATMLAKEPTIKTRLMMQECYGMTVGHQLQAEEYFNKLDSIKPIDLPFLTSYVGYAASEMNRYVRHLPKGTPLSAMAM